MTPKINLILAIPLIFLLLAPATTACEATQKTIPTPATPETTYRDPQGRFTAPIPANWTIQQAEGYGTATDPDGEITIYLLAVETNDIEAAIEEAWHRVDPSFDLVPGQIANLPIPDGIEDVVAVTYETEDENRFVQGLGLLSEETVYLIMADAQRSALRKRSSQVMVIQSGYTITGLDEADLSEVEPRPLTEEMLADFERYIEEVRQQFNVPGAAVAVVQGDEIIYELRL